MRRSRAAMCKLSEAELYGLAQTSGLGVAPSAPVQAPKEDLIQLIALRELRQSASATDAFYGLGIGLAPALLIADKEEVDGVKSILGESGRIVTVGEAKENEAALILHAHYFFRPPAIDSFDYGIGPFLGVRVTEGNPLHGLTMGILMGARGSQRSKLSFDFGYGYMLDQEFEVLAVGVVEGENPPGGPLVKLDDTWRQAILLSISWAP